MRVLHVVPTLAPEAGGPARSVRDLVTNLTRRGLVVTIAAHGADGPGSVELAHLPVPAMVLTKASLKALARAIASTDLVQIHGLWNGTASAAGMLSRRAQVPYVVTPRGMLDPYCLGHHGLRKRVYRALVEDATIRGASGFHFLSQEERDRAVVGRPLADDEVAVAPNAAPAVPPDLCPGWLRSRFPEVDGRLVALFLGRVDRIKGIDLQIEALARLEPEDRPVLLVVGPDYGDRRRLEGLVTTRGVERWVRWGGAVYGDDRLSLLADADVVLLTSHYDANPVVVTEALSVGGVVLATEGCGGVAAAASHGAAFVVPRTADALAAGLRGVCRDPARSLAVRRAARAYAADHLAPEQLLRPLLGLYDRIACLSRGASHGSRPDLVPCQQPSGGGRTGEDTGGNCR